MGVKPLTVAMVAAVLLVLTIAVDASINRTIMFDVQSNGTFRTVYEDPMPTEPSRARPQFYGPNTVTANRTDDVQMRLRVDNGYPWPFDEEYRVYVGGEEVHAGRIDVGGRDAGESTFSVPAGRLIDLSGGSRPVTEFSGPSSVFVSIEVRIHGETPFSPGFELREVSK